MDYKHAMMTLGTHTKITATSKYCCLLEEGKYVVFFITAFDLNIFPCFLYKVVKSIRTGESVVFIFEYF